MGDLDAIGPQATAGLDHSSGPARVVKGRSCAWGPGLQAILLGLLCLGTFASGLTGGFVLDDARAIVAHPVVQGTAPLGAAFRLTFWGAPLGADPPSWRPLTTLSFAL